MQIAVIIENGAVKQIIVSESGVEIEGFDEDVQDNERIHDYVNTNGERTEIWSIQPDVIEDKQFFINNASFFQPEPTETPRPQIALEPINNNNSGDIVAIDRMELVSDLADKLVNAEYQSNRITNLDQLDPDNLPDMVQWETAEKVSAIYTEEAQDLYNEFTEAIETLIEKSIVPVLGNAETPTETPKQSVYLLFGKDICATYRDVGIDAIEDYDFDDWNAIHVTSIEEALCEFDGWDDFEVISKEDFDKIPQH